MRKDMFEKQFKNWIKDLSGEECRNDYIILNALLESEMKTKSLSVSVKTILKSHPDLLLSFLEENAVTSYPLFIYGLLWYYIQNNYAYVSIYVLKSNSYDKCKIQNNMETFFNNKEKEGFWFYMSENIFVNLAISRNEKMAIAFKANKELREKYLSYKINQF